MPDVTVCVDRAWPWYTGFFAVEKSAWLEDTASGAELFISRYEPASRKLAFLLSSFNQVFHSMLVLEAWEEG